MTMHAGEHFRAAAEASGQSLLPILSGEPRVLGARGIEVPANLWDKPSSALEYAPYKDIENDHLAAAAEAAAFLLGAAKALRPELPVIEPTSNGRGRSSMKAARGVLGRLARQSDWRGTLSDLRTEACMPDDLPPPVVNNLRQEVKKSNRRDITLELDSMEAYLLTSARIERAGPVRRIKYALRLAMHAAQTPDGQLRGILLFPLTTGLAFDPARHKSPSEGTQS